MKYDIIVIGAGLGGLTCAATLAKKGKKVLVLEQHNIPGGAATVFERKGVRCEVGLHEMDWGKSGKNMKEIIFRKLGILDTLPMIKVPEVWRMKSAESEYTIPEGKENAIAYLKEHFPEEAKGIDRYFRDVTFTSRNNHALPNDINPIKFFFYPFTHFPIVLRNLFEQANVGNKLDKYFKSNRLKNIIDANLMYFSDDPYELSWTYHAAAQDGYYNSAVYIKGGSQILSNQLADVITNNNGEIRYLADVNKIELEGNKAVGVTYTNRKTKERITVAGKKIVANCSPDNVFYGNMLPEEFREPSIVNLKPACAIHSIYIITKEKMSKLYPNMAYSTFFFDEDLLDAKLSNITNLARNSKIGDRPAAYVDYSAIDSGLVPEGDPRGFGVLAGLSTLDEWSNLDKDAYKMKKEALAQSLFDRFDALYPGFKDNIDYYEVATPKTVQRYLKTPAGTAYGYKQIGYLISRTTPRTASQVKNLSFVGAWSFPGGGFTGAIISGYYGAINLIFPMHWRVIIGTATCTVVGSLIGMGIHKLIPTIKQFFQSL